MEAALKNSFAHCSRIAWQSSSNFYWSFWLLPRAKRRAMCALYAFARHTDDLSDNDGPVETRRGRLDEWRESLVQALDGRADNELLPAVADTAREFNIPHEYLFDLLDGVEMDLDFQPFETYDELREYCYRVASAVGLACLHVWGFTGDEAIEPAIQCGQAFQLTNILRDLKEDASIGRVYLPLEDLRRFNYSPAELESGVADQRLSKLLAFEFERAEQLYHAAAALDAHLHRDGQRAFNLMTTTYWRLLQQMKRQETDQVFKGRTRLRFHQKLSVAVPAMFGKTFRSVLQKK